MLGKIPLAVLVRGNFPETPWDAGEDAPSDVAEDTEAPGLSEPREGRLLVVGSARMFSNGLIRAFDNALFLLNAVDALTLGPDLVNIRGKTLKPRSYAMPEDTGKFWWRFFTVLLVPILVAVTGLVRHGMRRRARDRYVQQLQERKAA